MHFSILDQQQKQVIPYVGGHAIGNFDGRIYVCSGSTVYNLNPISWEKQVEVRFHSLLIKLLNSKWAYF